MIFGDYDGITINHDRMMMGLYIQCIYIYMYVHICTIHYIHIILYHTHESGYGLCPNMGDVLTYPNSKLFQGLIMVIQWVVTIQA